MDKELTPLEALESIKTSLFWSEDGLKNIETIETALKRIPDLEMKIKTRDIVLNAIRKDDEISDKKLEALEIIKDRFSIQFSKSDLSNYYGIMQIGINPVYIKTQEEFDLLKEVLL